MPVDRTIAEDLAQTLADMYRTAQDRITVDIAHALKAGIDRPDWAEAKLRALGTLERHIRGVLAQLGTSAQTEIEQALMLAYVRGGRAALQEVARLQLTPLERLALGNQVDGMARLAELAAKRRLSLARIVDQVRRDLPGIDALQRLAFSLTTKTQGTHLRILRWAEDAYRDVIGRATAPQVLLGTKTRLRAAQTAWEQLLGQGITGFVDKSGRRWELASYVEMATRTTVAQAAVQGHLDRLSAAGLDLVIVSNAPQECVRCRPWEGKILARNGPGGNHFRGVAKVIEDGKTVPVEVAGSVDEAVAAGLMHPNCRHSLSAYLPGVTKPITHTEDPEGDEARQQQRAIERRIRAAKRDQAAAIDPAAKKAVGARVRDLQAEMREHLDAHPDLFRKPVRERNGAAR